MCEKEEIKKDLVQWLTEEGLPTAKDILAELKKLNVANNEVKQHSVESLEDYFKREVEDGYLSENGAPIKCKCGCSSFKQVDMFFGEGYLEEYALECMNQDCRKIVGRWSYGNWII